MSAAKPEFIDYNGKKIFYLNFSHMEKDATPAFREEAKSVLSPQPTSSVLFLANVNKMSFDKQVVKNFAEFFRFTKTST